MRKIPYNPTYLILTGLPRLDRPPPGDRAVHAWEVHGVLLRQTDWLNVVREAHWSLQDNHRQIIGHVGALSEVLVDVQVLNKDLRFRVLVNICVVISESDEVGALGEAHQTVSRRQHMEP